MYRISFSFILLSGTISYHFYFMYFRAFNHPPIHLFILSPIYIFWIFIYFFIYLLTYKYMAWKECKYTIHYLVDHLLFSWSSWRWINVRFLWKANERVKKQWWQHANTVLYIFFFLYRNSALCLISVLNPLPIFSFVYPRVLQIALQAKHCMEQARGRNYEKG